MAMQNSSSVDHCLAIAPNSCHHCILEAKAAKLFRVTGKDSTLLDIYMCSTYDLL